jgi:uncharacterized protein (DUF302 family)
MFNPPQWSSPMFRIPVLALLLLIPPAFAQTGLTQVKSAHSVAETAQRLEAALKEKGLTLVARVDHTEAAKKVGMELRPTVLFIFGNPKSGTPLMQCGQSMGIDLPLKALIWEDKEGQVWFGYNDLQYLAKRHGISGCEAPLKQAEGALSALATAATAR